MASDASQETLAAAKRAGENAEHHLTAAVDALDPASGEDHYDAVATTAVFPSEDLPMVGVTVVEAGSLVEIKSTMVVQTDAQRRGRFKLRRTQHETLLDAGAFYAFVVCEPVPKRHLLAAKIVPATIVDDLVGPDGVASWRDEQDGRGDKAQLAWTNLFDPVEVEGR